MFRKKALLAYLFLLIALSLFYSASSAHADELERIAAVHCDSKNNQFMVRFGMLWNDSPIDQSVLYGFNGDTLPGVFYAPLQKGGFCTLSNGKKFEITTKSAQAYAYGMGGADPTVNFSLKMNGKNLYYKNNFYEGYGTGKYRLAVIYYHDSKLYECTPEGVQLDENKSHNIFGEHCTDVSGRLSGQESNFSKDEKIELSRDKNREKIKANVSNKCQNLKSSISIHDGNKSYQYLGRTKDSSHLSILEADINNDGHTDTIYRIGGGSSDCGVGCGTHYFDGSYLVVLLNNAKASSGKVYNYLQNHNLHENHEVNSSPITYLPEIESYLISISESKSSIRYIYNIPFESNLEWYIYSFEVSEKAIPRRIISQFTANNELKTICRFAD